MLLWRSRPPDSDKLLVSKMEVHIRSRTIVSMNLILAMAQVSATDDQRCRDSQCQGEGEMVRFFVRLRGPRFHKPHSTPQLCGER